MSCKPSSQCILDGDEGGDVTDVEDLIWWE